MKIYPDDLSDEEWAIIEPLLKTKHWNRGPKPIYSKRSMLNAIFYVCRTGCGWRHLPKDYPPWPIVYSQFKRWKVSNVYQNVLDQLRRIAREKSGKNAEPTAAIVDSQSVKTTERGASKVTTGVKRLKGANDTSWWTPKVR